MAFPQKSPESKDGLAPTQTATLPWGGEREEDQERVSHGRLTADFEEYGEGNWPVKMR
jgi:hypothetical protein